MSIEGRINVDVLFHDKDGTASIKIVNLDGITQHATGKVAVINGTCSTTSTPLALQPTTYRDASGSLVSFTTVQRAVVKANVGSLVFHRYEEHSVGETAAAKGTLIGSGHVAVVGLDNADLDPLAAGSPAVQSYSGTSSYTIVIYGT